jgi:Putative transmembrane protein (PGPGW)
MAPHDIMDRTDVTADEEEGMPGKKEEENDDDSPSVPFVSTTKAPPDGAVIFTETGSSNFKTSERDQNISSETSDTMGADDGPELHASDGFNQEDATSTNEGTPTAQTFSQQFSNLRKRMSERRAGTTASATLASEAAATKAAKEEQAKQPSAVEKEMEKLQEADLDSMRASQISVTIVKDATESYGFALVQDEENMKACVKIDLLVENGLLNQSPLKVGDTLKTVNNKKVTNCDKVMEDLLAMEGPVTLVVETPKGNPSLVQAFCRKPSKESKVGIGFHILEHGDHKLLQINHLDSNGLLSHSALSQGDIVLAINDIPCAEKSPGEAAALILESTSTVTIVALNPRLASRQHGGSLGPRAQKWMRGAKRVGIAIGGGTCEPCYLDDRFFFFLTNVRYGLVGTMVGVGLIFIPTLPPPFGEVLIVGGVSVLGTEFEAPKRLVRSTRDSLERAVGRAEPKTNEQVEGDGQIQTAQNDTELSIPVDCPKKENECDSAREAGPNGAVDYAALEAAVASTHLSSTKSKDTNQPKRTMKERMKSFGRNYVLPFLDQVVGDRPHDSVENVGGSESVDHDSSGVAGSSVDSEIIQDETNEKNVVIPKTDSCKDETETEEERASLESGTTTERGKDPQNTQNE